MASSSSSSSSCKGRHSSVRFINVMSPTRKAHTSRDAAAGRSDEETKTMRCYYERVGFFTPAARGAAVRSGVMEVNVF